MIVVATSPAPAPVVDARETLTSLARYETGRLLRHPAFLLGALVFVVLCTTAPFSGYADADFVTTGNRETNLDFPVLPAFALGLFGLVAMNRIASGSDRNGEVLDAAPMPPYRRSLALCLACLLPAAVALVGTTYMHVVYFVNPPVNAENWGELSQAELVALNLTGVIAALGGPLVGVLVARWWRWPAAGAVACVLLVLWSVSSLAPDKNVVLTLNHVASPFTLVASNGEDYSWHMGGSWLWKVPYLLGLCGLAVIGACAKGAEGTVRRRLVRAARLVGAVTLACLVIGTVVGPDGFYSWDHR